MLWGKLPLLTMQRGCLALQYGRGELEELPAVPRALGTTQGAALQCQGRAEHSAEQCQVMQKGLC